MRSVKSLARIGRRAQLKNTTDEPVQLHKSMSSKDEKTTEPRKRRGPRTLMWFKLDGVPEVRSKLGT